MALSAGRDSLIVFAKPPVPGKVKTRLHSGIDPSEATELYVAFLDDSLSQYTRMGLDIRLYVHGESSEIDRLSVSLHDKYRQRGDDLGSRMQQAFAETFVAGYERIVIIGTDHPSLPDEFIELAFDILSRPRSIVIGPAEDGGYYLLGMNQFYPELFEAMIFSRDDVFDQTVDRAFSTGAELTILPPWYDVDRPETLGRLFTDLAENRHHAPKTLAVLLRLAARYNWIVESPESGARF